MSAAPPRPDLSAAPPAWAGQARGQVTLDRLAAGLALLCAGGSVLVTGGVVLVLAGGLLGSPTSPDLRVLAGLLGGSAQVALLALLVALPLGGGAALVLSEVASPPARRLLLPPLRLVAILPGVLWGFLAVAVLAPVLQPLLPRLAAHSTLVAGLILGVMLMPGVVTLAMQALRAVPDAQREAAAALGASPLETLRQVVLPAARPGLVVVALLTLARALGEGVVVALAASAVRVQAPAHNGGLLAPTETLASWLLTAPQAVPSAVLWDAAVLLFLLVGGLHLLGAAGQRHALRESP